MKNLLVILGLLVVSSVRDATAQANCACLGAPNGQFVRNSRGCNHWFICNNQQVQGEGVCPVGFDFDPSRQTCRYIGLVECSQCAQFGTQAIPSPTSCSEFIQCIDGTGQPMACPNGQQFNPEIAQCQANFQCVLPPGPTPPGTTPCPTLPTQWPETTTPPPTQWPTDPTTAPTEWTTQPTGDWNTETTAQWPSPEEPSTTTTQFPTPPEPSNPPPSNIQCTGTQIHHAHPTSCNHFYMCIGGQAELRKCPSDLHWNQMENNCDFPGNAGCIIN